jgi:hypothetical protein
MIGGMHQTDSMQAVQGESMPRNRTTRQMRAASLKFAHLTLGAAAVVALVAFAHVSAARAGDDDDISSKESFSEKFWKTLGVKNPGDTEYEINYSERSPLVVPPSRTLPPPVNGAATAPNWPRDPDAAKRKAKKDDKPVIQQYDRAAEADRALRPDELNNVSRNTRTVSAPGVGEQSEPVNKPKRNLFDFSWMNPNRTETATFTGEPARANLTDPPPGYLTPSPDQPYGLVPEHKAYTPKTLGERMEPTR